MMFSDIRGFTSYTARAGDRAAYELSRAHELLLKEQIEKHNGIVVKTMGDGIMAAFAELPSGVHAAVGIQKAIRERNRRHGADQIDIGIGLASGTPIVTEADLIGNSVNLSQRVSSLAKGGEILATEQFVKEVSTNGEYRFIPLGKRELKGIGAVDLYEVAWMAEVARLTDRNDRLTLILTERGTVVAELAKRATADGPLFPSLIRRGTELLERGIIDKSIAGIGIDREQPIENVDLSPVDGGVILRVGRKRIRLRGVDPMQAEFFREKMIDLKRELHAESKGVD